MFCSHVRYVCLYVCMYVYMYVCMHVCTKSFLKTKTNSSCVCTHLANKADSDSDSVQEAGREWNLMGILGTEGEGGGIRITLFKFLNDTGLMSRIWIHLKWHDVTHSCTVGGGMHLKVVCNPPLTKRRRRTRPFPPRGTWSRCWFPSGHNLP